MAWVEHDYASADELSAKLAGLLRQTCVDAMATRGRVLLALAGGRTPLPLYARMAERPFDWAGTTLMPTDERCVPHDHPACNLRALREAFAQARGLGWESLTVPDGDPGRSQAHAAAMLAAHAEPFDVVLLGMGADGHVASLFPGAPQLVAALDPGARADACRVDPEPLPPEAPFPRISLTLQRLLRSRAIHLLVAGEAKRAVLRRAQAGNDPRRHPVAAVLHAPGMLAHIHWSP